MSSPSLTRLREAFPDRTASLNDDDLTLFLGDSRPDLLEQDPELNARYRELRPGDIPAALGTAVQTGFGDRLPATGAGVLAAIARDAISRGGPELARALPLERVEQAALDYRARQVGEAAESWSDPAVRPIARVEDIRTDDGVVNFIRDLALVAGPGVIESAPSVLTSLGAGVAASRFAPSAAGQIAAAGLASAAQNLGDTYGELASRPDADRNRALEAALPASVAAGALDTLGLIVPASRLFPGLRASQIGEAVSGVLARGGLSGAAASAVAGAPAEGVTELMQEALAIAAEEQATGVAVPAEEARSRLLNAAVVGTAAGGAFAAPAGLVPAAGGRGPVGDGTNGTDGADGTNAETPAPDLRRTAAGLDLPETGGDLSGGITAEEAAFLDLQQRAEAIRDGALPGFAPEADAVSLPEVELSPLGLVDEIDLEPAPSPPAPDLAAETVSAPVAPAPEPAALGSLQPEQPAPSGAVSPAPDASTNPDTSMRGEPPPFRVAQFGTRALPDRVSTAKAPDPRGRSGRVGIVLERAGRAYGRLAYKSGGELRVEGVDFDGRSKGGTASLRSLEKAGFRVLYEPFQFDRPSPGFRVDATPAEFDGWMGRSQEEQARIREVIAEGSGDRVLEELLTRADPEAMQAVNTLQAMVTEASGADRSRVLLALGQRIDSNARGGLRATNVLKKLADAELDATKLLRAERGKILGRWTKAEWEILKAAAANPEVNPEFEALRAAGAPTGATPATTAEAMILEKFRGRGESWAEARSTFAGWAASRADEGLRTQMGGDAYAGRGQAAGGGRGGAGRVVEVSLDAGSQSDRATEGQSDRLDAEVAAAGVDTSAEEAGVEAEGDATEDLPLSPGLENTPPAELRATLNAFGISDEQIDFVLGEVAEGDGTFEETAEVVVLDPELRSALRAVDDPVQQRNLVQALYALSTQARRREGGGETDVEPTPAPGQPGGDAGAAPGAVGAAGEARLTRRELAQVIPGGLGPVAAEPQADGTVAYAPKPPESEAAVDFNVETARASLGGRLGMAMASASEAVDAWRRRNPRAPAVRVVVDPSLRIRDRGVRGLYRDGGLLLNAAYVRDAAEVEAVLNHEWAHRLLDSDAGRAELAAIAAREMTAPERRELAADYPRAKGETAEAYALRLADEWVAKVAETEPGRWQRFVDAVRAFLAKLGLANLSDEEVARAALRRLRERGDGADYVGAERLSVTAAPVGNIENPAVTINQTMAALNAAAEIEADLAPVLAKQGLTLEAFREEFGFADPQALKIRAQQRAAAGGASIAGVNPAQTFDDFAATANAARARILAYQAAQQRKATLGKAVLEAAREAETLRNRAKARLNAFNEAHRGYLAADGLTALVQRGVRGLLARERKLAGRLGTQMGAVMQLVRELDARADEVLDRDYAGVFAKLARNRDLTGRNLFDLLDTLVSQASIDFKGAKVTEIRQAIAERLAANPDRAELGLLVQNTPESRALLATLVAYAKTNEAVLLQIERRRERNAAERVRLQEALDALLADRKILDQAVKDLPKTAKLEERARMAYAQARQRLRAIERQAERAEARANAARAAIPVYQRALAELGRAFNLRPHVSFGDGMTYHVPPSVDADGEALRGGAKTLRLNSAGEVTNRAELERDLEAMTRWLQHREATDARDADYFVVKAERDELLAGGWFDGDLRKVDTLTSTLFLQPVGVQAASFGTASGRLIAQMMQRYTSAQGELKARGEKLGAAFEAKRDALRQALLAERAAEAKDLTADRLYALFYDPVASLFEKERGLLELGLGENEVRSRLLQKAMNQLAANPETAPYVRGREAAVAPALRAFLQAAEEASAFYNDYNAKHGLGVKDARLIVEGLNGEAAAGIRDSLPQGVATFSRQMSRGLKLTHAAMQAAGWDGFAAEVRGVAALYEEGGAEAVRDVVAPYFTEAVLQGFVKPLATMETYSAFDAPSRAEGDLRPEADPALAAEAWARADGDVVAFAENLFDLHGGGGDRAAYIQQVLQRMADYHGQVKDLQDPAGSGVQLAGLGGAVRNLMIDARVLERWPTAWSEYVTFDRQTNHNLNSRAAAQVAFGRDTERLAAVFKTLEQEVAQSLVEYRTWEREALEAGLARGAAPGLASAVDKAVRARFVAKYGADKGRAEWKRLRDLAQREALIPAMQENLRAFFSSRDGDLGARRFASALGGALASGVLNQPGTALMQLTELFSPIIQTGASGASLRQVLRNVKFLGEDLAGSLAQAIGLQLGQGSRLTRRFAAMGLSDPLAVRRFVDATRDADRRGDDTGAAARLLRRIPQVQGVGLTRLGEASRYTVLRPFAPFSAAAIATHRANTLSLWARVEDMVARAAEHLRANPAAAADPAYEVTAEALGLRGFEAQSFETLRKRMAEGYDLPLARLAREAEERQSGRGQSDREAILDDRTRALLHGMALNEVTLEGNLANMNPKAFTSSALRLILPLWGWPIRRALQVAGLRLDPQGRATMQALRSGLLALAVVSAGSLALSVLIDEYHEEVLRKARNLRSARALPELLAKGELREALLTFIEASNRVGTAGLFGDIANTALNTGQGGDNRGISLDQRVLMMNSLLGFYRATSNLIAQGEADYAGVVRPYLASLGGNGVLQYMQLVNSAAEAGGAGPVFGREEAFARRISAQNWLRVAGRTERLEVRAGAGGTATPTPLTPAMTRMALAAYADDRAGFARAWREAVALARREGKEDPLTYVRDSFAARHPLRTVFRSISEGDYTRLLRRLPGDGAAEVRSAVGAYNRYLESIEGSAYLGSKR